MITLAERFENRNYISEEGKEQIFADWKALKIRQILTFKHGVFYLKTKEGYYVYDQRVFRAKIKWHQAGCKPSVVTELQNGNRKGSKRHTKGVRRKGSV